MEDDNLLVLFEKGVLINVQCREQGCENVYIGAKLLEKQPISKDVCESLPPGTAMKVFASNCSCPNCKRFFNSVVVALLPHQNTPVAFGV